MLNFRPRHHEHHHLWTGMWTGMCTLAIAAAALVLVAADDFDDNVKQVTDADFKEWRAENPNSFIMFYAPWCGHCKNMKPDYTKLSEDFADDSSVAIAAGDCTGDAKDTCSEFGVSGFPTIMYFEGAESEGEKYSGGRDAAEMLGWLKHKTDPDWVDPNADPNEGLFETQVPQLGDGDFAAWREENPKSLVMFYAPWCGHCKSMKPAWVQAHTAMSEEKFSLAAMDCTGIGKDTCSELDVSGFPTIMYFPDAKSEGEDFDGARTAKGIKKFLKQLDDPTWNEPFVDEAVWGDDNGKVVHLGDDHFQWYRETNPGPMLVFFYAPWCGHCKNAKPEYGAASKRFSGKKGSVRLAAVDCTEATVVCGEHGVSGYPTIKYFEANGDVVDYDGGREEVGFYNWIDSRLRRAAKAEAAAAEAGDVDVSKLKLKALKQMLKDRGLECKGCTDKTEFVELLKANLDAPKVEKKKFKMTWAEEQRAKAAKEHAEVGWEGGNGAVTQLTDQTFDEYRKVNPQSVVMFYADWCGHCKAMKPDLVAASEMLADEPTKLAAIECDKNPTTCQKFGVTGYPKVMHFDSEESKGEAVNIRNKKGIMKFVKQIADPEWEPEVVPFVNEPEWGDESGDVVFLTDDHFHEYRKDHPKMLVMFYAPWCGHCKSMKPEFAEASTELADLKPKVSLVAVDCTVNSEVCGEFGVNGYPAVKWFNSATDTPADESLPRTKDGIVTTVNERASDDWSPPEPTPTPTAEEWGKEEGVVHLGDDDFEAARKEKVMLVMFYAPWCGHCKAMKPAFTEAAAEAASSSALAYAAVDCTVHTKVCGKFGVKGYPTMMYVDAKSKKDYSGGRDKASLVQFGVDKAPLTAEASDDANTVTTAEQLTLARGKGPTMVLYTSSDDSCTDCVKAAKIIEAAREDAEGVSMLQVNCKKSGSVPGCSGAQYPAFMLYLTTEDEGTLYTGKLKHFALLTFIDMHVDEGHDEL